MKIKKKQSIFKNLLKIKSSKLMTTIVCIILFFSFNFIIYKAAKVYVIKKAEEKTQSILLHHRGIHHYIQQKILPELYRCKESGEIGKSFYSPILFSSTYMVRNIHSYHNKELGKVGKESLYYKMASDNPRNPINKADPKEHKILQMFNKNPDLTEYREIIEIEGRLYLQMALPFLTTNKDCLKCHGRREKAPLELQNLYKGNGGFGEKIGDIRAIESIRIPIDDRLSILNIVILTSAVVILVFLALIGFNYRLRTTVETQTSRLQTSEERYRLFVDNATDAFYISDMNGQFKDVNKAACIALGYTHEELLGMTISDIDVNFTKNNIFEILESLTEDEPKLIESLHKRKTGDIFPVEVRIKSFKIEGQTLLLSLARDITKRKQTDNMLKNNSQELSSIFRVAPTGIGVVCNRVITKINDRFCEMTGYSQNELIGQSARILYPNDEEFEYVGNEKYKQISEKGTGTVETKFLCKDGKIIDVILSSTPLNLDDLSKGVTFTALDITYLKKKEFELSESEEKYRSMMEAMDEPAYICSSKYLVEYMNPAMIKRTGRDAIDELCYKVIHGLDKKCPWCVFEKVIKDEPINHEITSPKDNKTFHISNSPIFHSDGSISKLTIFRDITDFKKIETQLQQAQKMESIGTLAGGIAHDFNNILFPVFGYLEMAIEDIPEDSPVRDQLTEVLNGAQRARDLVKQILTFSRQSDHELKPLKTQLIIREALKLLRSSIPSTIEMNQNINKGCGLVMADPTHIHQIVMNLCTNAFHAMEESGGKLNVTLEEIQLTIDDLKDPTMAPGPHICLMVSDTGHGMDQHIIDRIFDPYFTTKEVGKGTGLGLAVIHSIVKDYDGHINVYSKPGKGTEFKIYLPIIQSSKTIAKTENNLPLQKGNEHILLVDDENPIAQLEKRMLERLGYRVTAQTNSIDALELFRAKSDNFDLVITDMTMPNMTGDKLAGELVKIRPEIPIILCTGFSETMSEEKAAYLGIKGFLLKPIVTKDLSHKVREVLDKNIKEK